MRKQNVYVLVDLANNSSDIESEERILSFISEIYRSDPYKLEVCNMSVITYDEEFAYIAKNNEVFQFDKDFHLANSNKQNKNLGNAIKEVMNNLQLTFVKTTIEVRGDWDPDLIIISNGLPTDLTVFKNEIKFFMDLYPTSKVMFIDKDPIMVLRCYNICAVPWDDYEFAKSFLRSWSTDTVETNTVETTDYNGESINGIIPPPPPEVQIFI